MPKSKQGKVSPKGKRSEVLRAKDKPRGRPRKKQNVVPDRLGHRSIDGFSRRRSGKRILREPSVPQPTLRVGSNIAIPTPPSKVHPKAKHVRPPEIQELRGRPDPVATVTAENFKCMGHDLQCTMRGLFHDLSSAIGKPHAPADPNFSIVSKQHHRRETRASAHDSSQFFKKLVPKDKLPELDEHIKVHFEGTNTITTEVPGYTETITFGDGCWRRAQIDWTSGTSVSRTETGRLDDGHGARIAEQTELMILGIMRYTADTLAGMLGLESMPGESVGSSRRALSPTGLRARRTSISIPAMRVGM